MKDKKVQESESHFWDRYASWQEAEHAWDSNAESAKKEKPLRVLQELPQIPGITEETKKNLSWKSFLWMIQKDTNFRLMKQVLRHPFRHSWNYIRSLFRKKSYLRDDDLFLYGLKSLEHMKSLMEAENSVLIVGFSYCEKPHECPSGRFNDDCVRDLSNPVCRQCFIGKSLHTLPIENTVPLIIPTIHYIGEKVFEVIEKMKGKQVLFLITACEMTLEMFGDWGNLAGIQGVGVRLDGRICNTMRAFELSERGIKPGLTVVLPRTEKRILELLAFWRQVQKRYSR